MMLDSDRLLRLVIVAFVTLGAGAFLAPLIGPLSGPEQVAAATIVVVLSIVYAAMWRGKVRPDSLVRVREIVASLFQKPR